MPSVFSLWDQEWPPVQLYVSFQLALISLTLMSEKEGSFIDSDYLYVGKEPLDRRNCFAPLEPAMVYSMLDLVSEATGEIGFSQTVIATFQRARAPSTMLLEG